MDNKLTKTERKTIEDIRARGFAVIIWNPKELENVSPSYMEERSVELGWEVIETLRD